MHEKGILEKYRCLKVNKTENEHIRRKKQGRRK